MEPLELERYARHLSLPEIGEAGQLRLKQSRVLIVGAGGLGCPAALYLASAGVGTIGIVDPDRVDRSNLQRQILYRDSDVGEPKAEVAAERLREVNPFVTVHSYAMALGQENALSLIGMYDVVLDATDNFSARYLVNDACFFLKRANVFASVTRFEGRLAVLCYPGAPCYRCVFPAPPQTLVLNCAVEGVLGVVPGLMGSYQALAALKILLEGGPKGPGYLKVFDLREIQSRTLAVTKNPCCPLCGESPSITELREIRLACGAAATIDNDDLAEWVEQNPPPVLVDVRDLSEAARGTLPGAVLLPLSRLLSEPMSFEAGRKIVVFCQSGKRSQAAALKLMEQGHRQVYSLAGGLASWKGPLTPSQGETYETRR